MGKKATAAAGFTALFSVFCLVEGVLRIINAIAAGRATDWKSDSDATPPKFPPIVLLLASLTEVIFALAGLVAGLLPLVYRVHNAMLSAFALGVEACGWFTFIVYVFAKPAYEADHADYSLHGPDFTESESDGLVALGILGSVAYCGAMQGGQFFFTLQLLTIQKGEEEERHTKTFFRLRHIYYSFLLLLSGVVGLAFGSMTFDNAGDGQLIPPVVQPPWFVIYPELTITVGCITTFVALFSIIKAIAGIAGATGVLGGLLTLSFLSQVTMMVITQISLLNSNMGINRTFVGGMLAVLSLALHLMPAYLDSMMGKSDD